ncbi:helix-turn-helix domain-containing protein [Wenjunlia tyrosinilytica]|nr:helix-turn-helix transcriptional regulator [Wenjunlia tyrosinilytica]
MNPNARRGVPPPLIAQRLNRLFEVIFPAGQRPWSNTDVSYSTGVPEPVIARLRQGLPLEEHDGDQHPRFVARLTFLFATRTSPTTGRGYTNSEVARAAGITGAYIGYLLSGKRGPTLAVTEALAQVFGVSVAFFTDDTLTALARRFGVTVDYFTDDATAEAVGRDLEALEHARADNLVQVMGRTSSIGAVKGSDLDSMVERLRADSKLQRILGRLLQMPGRKVTAVDVMTEQLNSDNDAQPEGGTD